jgi:hypothetical protein
LALLRAYPIFHISRIKALVIVNFKRNYENVFYGKKEAQLVEKTINLENYQIDAQNLNIFFLNPVHVHVSSNILLIIKKITLKKMVAF